MAKRRTIKIPQRSDTSGLCSADELRWYIAYHPRFGGLTDERLAKVLGISAGYVGMIMSGARPPTKAFLKAIGWEAVTFYRMQNPRRLRSVA